MTLDTNILIAYLNGEARVVETITNWQQAGRALFLSPISTAEVFALPTIGPEDIETVRRFLREFISVPFDDTLAETAALIKRTYGLRLPDAAIAATALGRGTALVTRDRQFKKIRELPLIEI